MQDTNPNSRLEAFCDGVFAIALTLLIIDIKIPATAEIKSTEDFWITLKNMTPSVFAFLLSFIIILITWVNHHNGLKLVHKSSASLIYSNGVLLLGVVFIPFPTSLMGEYLLTEHAAPAVTLYNSVLALLAIGWLLMSRAALKGNLAKSEKAIRFIRQNGKYSYFAFALYFLLAIAATWFPLTVAMITTITWIFWLILGINLKHE